MQDLAIELENRPGALAEMGEALGRAGASVEGGGAWLTSPAVGLALGLGVASPGVGVASPGLGVASPGVGVASPGPGVALTPAAGLGLDVGVATGIAHFLFHDGDLARRALESAGIRVLQQRDVVVLRLRQDEPGQLGKLSRRMADAGVNIEALYSDHDHQLILVVDDFDKARVVSDEWSRESLQGNSK